MVICTQNDSTIEKLELGDKHDTSAILAIVSSTSSHLMTNMSLVPWHFTEYRMDAIFYFSTHDSTIERFINSQSQFTKEAGSKQSEELG
jgi:hypothetical protein